MNWIKVTPTVTPMMARRNFLKAAAAVVIFPSSLLAVTPPKSNLIWSELKGEWCPQHVVRKGPYAAIFHSEMRQLTDCHGLCATEEVLAILVMELEYGRDAIKKVWDIPYENTAEREAAWKRYRRCELTKEEMKEIYQFITKLRGPHDCVRQYDRA